MELDEHGLPKPQDFRENSWRNTQRVTPFRMSLLLFAVVMAVLITTGVAYFPELAKRFDQFRKDQRREQARTQLFVAANLSQRGDHDRALKLVNEVLRADPGDRLARDIRATVFAGLKRYQEAIADCTYLIEHDPNEAMPYNNRAYFRALARVDIPEAMKDVEKAIAKEGDVPAYIDTRGYIHYLLGDFNSALKDFDAVLNNKDIVGAGRGRKPEEYGEIHFHRGLVYKHMGKPALQQKDYQAARSCGYRITEEPPPLNPGAAAARDA